MLLVPYTDDESIAVTGGTAVIVLLCWVYCCSHQPLELRRARCTAAPPVVLTRRRRHILDCEIGTIGFLAPKNIHLDTRVKSRAAFDPQIIANVDFKWRPF